MDRQADRNKKYIENYIESKTQKRVRGKKRGKERKHLYMYWSKGEEIESEEFKIRVGGE